MLTGPSLHFSPPDVRSRRKKAVIRDSCLVIRDPKNEARDTTVIISLFLRNACLPCSTYGQVRLRAPFSSARLAPRPDGPLTHSISPRGEKYRLELEEWYETRQ